MSMSSVISHSAKELPAVKSSTKLFSINEDVLKRDLDGTMMNLGVETRRTVNAAFQHLDNLVEDLEISFMHRVLPSLVLLVLVTDECRSPSCLAHLVM